VSEDVRARLYALTEQPERWEKNLTAWAEHNRPFKTEVEGRAAPDANEEYLLYQFLLGAWPLGMELPSPEFIDRMRGTMRKAVSEAKVNTNWVQPNKPWLEAMDRFVTRLLDPDSGFLPLFLPEARALAEHGMVNSLSQVVLKATSPGMPDFYQGTEAWEFNLVDPDNRRPVDYAARQKLLAGLDGRAPAELLAHWRDGGIKMHVTRALLRFRRKNPELFQEGDYRAVAVRGKWVANVVAFTRNLGGKTLLVVVPRFPSRVGLPPIGKLWGDTRLDLVLPEGGAMDLLSGAALGERNAPRLADLCAVLPCAAVVVGT
jgi:(1->4)-alpha-D-glucan 1-alpha-D-glucosylmutase